MNAITQAIYDRLAGDVTLATLLATYAGRLAMFTIDPAVPDATKPYIVSNGQWIDGDFDTKTNLGRRIFRDVRCYAAADGDAIPVEQIAERVRELFHRQHKQITVPGYQVIVAECSGPVASNEQDAYGRLVTVKLIMMEV